MAKANPIKSSFNGGELSPRMAGRVDEAKYHAGCSVLQNFIPTVQGPIIRRGGTYYGNEVNNSAQRTWLVPFFLNVTQSYMLEFGNEYIRFYTNRGAVLENAITITGATQANPCAITATNNYSAGDKIYITGVVGMTQLNNKYYRVGSSGLSSSGFTLEDTDGNAIDSTAFTAYSSAGTAARVYTLATPYAYSDLTDSNGNFFLKFEQSEDVLYIFHPKYPTQQLSYYGQLAWTMAKAAIVNGPFGSINSNQNSLVYVTPTTTSVSATAATTTNSESITAFSAGAVSGAGNLIRLTVSSTSNFVTGMPMTVAGVTGTDASSINGNWTINVIDGTHVDLVGSIWASGMSGASSGTVAYPTGTIRLTVSSTTGFTTGNSANVFGIAGTVEANGVWTVVVISATKLDLIGSTYANAYSSGGTVNGRDGTAITITANTPIFNNVGADEVFLLQNPVTTNLSQWQPGASVTKGQRWQSGIYTYIALNTATTGEYTPVHYQGARWDGPNSTGVQWLFDDAGYGIIQLTSITSPSSAAGTISITPPNATTSSTSQTFLWAHGLFGSVQGYPNAGRVFRDRLCLAIGIQLATSKTNNYLDFNPLVNGLQTADAAIVISLPSSTPVQWMTAQNSLLLGTSQNEIAVGEVDTSQPFSPTNNQARVQTSHGSKYVDGLPIEYLNMFITRSGQQLCQQMFNWAINGYMAEDMTVLSEHIPKGPDGKQGISQMCWQQEPDKIIWACTTDGRLVGLTYNREQEVFCWHNHPLGGTDAAAPLYAKGFTNAVIESVATIPSPDATQDDLWVIVKRTINGVERRYVEWLVPYFTDIQANVPNAIYMDAAITYNGAATNYATGANHLIGQTVDVLISGGVHPQVVVDANGGVTLEYSGTPIQIGLPCPAQVVTMRVDAGSQLGSAQGTLKRIHKLVMRLLNTLTGNFGAQGATLNQLQFRTPQMPMDAPPDLFTGDSRQDYPGGYDSDAFIQMTFTQPLPATVVALRPELEVQEITQ